VHTDGTIRYAFFTQTSEPEDVVDALQNERWREAMNEEYEALVKNKT
jgi:hypothetical protein